LEERSRLQPWLDPAARLRQLPCQLEAFLRVRPCRPPGGGEQVEETSPPPHHREPELGDHPVVMWLPGRDSLVAGRDRQTMDGPRHVPGVLVAGDIGQVVAPDHPPPVRIGIQLVLDAVPLVPACELAAQRPLEAAVRTEQHYTRNVGSQILFHRGDRDLRRTEGEPDQPDLSRTYLPPRPEQVEAPAHSGGGGAGGDLEVAPLGDLGNYHGGATRRQRLREAHELRVKSPHP